MKRTYLKRHTRLTQGRALKLAGRLPPVNRKRGARANVEDFGQRGEAVRAMRCLVDAKHFEDQAGPSAYIRSLLALGHPANTLACRGDVQAAHINGSRGAGYNRRSLGPLCAFHHEQSGERGRESERSSQRARFESLYGIDLTAEALRLALDFDARGLP